MAEQGWTGIIFPEEYGRFGMGMVEMVATLEEMGRALLPGPFFSTVLMAGTVLESAGDEGQKDKYLAPICRGEAKATVAFLEESASWDPSFVRLNASASSGGYALDRLKLLVPDAAVADFLICVARLAGELALFVVPSNTPGLRITYMPTMDATPKLYEVSFQNVTIGRESLLAYSLPAQSALKRARDIATVGLVAEMTGGMQRLLEITVEYAKTRKRFCLPLGRFQAVQHQCA